MMKAEIADVIAGLASQCGRIANAIRPCDALPGSDSHGGSIDSLTEAVMSVGRSLDGVAEGLHDIAAAIRESKPE